MNLMGPYIIFSEENSKKLMKLVVSEKNLGVGDRSGESVAFGFKTCSVKKKKKEKSIKTKWEIFGN